jgi:hypothetical protein
VQVLGVAFDLLTFVNMLQSEASCVQSGLPGVISTSFNFDFVGERVGAVGSFELKTVS